MRSKKWIAEHLVNQNRKVFWGVPIVPRIPEGWASLLCCCVAMMVHGGDHIAVRCQIIAEPIKRQSRAGVAMREHHERIFLLLARDSCIFSKRIRDEELPKFRSAKTRRFNVDPVAAGYQMIVASGRGLFPCQLLLLSSTKALRATPTVTEPCFRPFSCARASVPSRKSGNKNAVALTTARTALRKSVTIVPISVADPLG